MEEVLSRSSSGRTSCWRPDSNNADLLTSCTRTGESSQLNRGDKSQPHNQNMDTDCIKRCTRYSTSSRHAGLSSSRPSSDIHSHRRTQTISFLRNLTATKTTLLLLLLTASSLATLASCSSAQHHPSPPGSQHHRRPRDLPPPGENYDETTMEENDENQNTAQALGDGTVLVGGRSPEDSSRAPGEAEGFSPEDLQRLRAYIDRVRSPGCRDIPSVSVAVVSDGRTVLTEGRGWADLGGDHADPSMASSRVAADRHTLYCVASLSKAFTAALLARLLDRKGLTLDVPVRDILRDKYPFRDDYVTRHVTVRDLLLHRTGIPRYDYLWISGAEDSDAIFRRIRCMKHSKEFRSGALYNNVLYALAGHVAEELGGASWETLLRRELLDPLGMTSTTFIREVLEDRTSSPHNTTMAHHYVWEGFNIDIGDPLLRGARDISPAIGVFSTAHDMAIWVNFQLSGGRNSQGHQLIPTHIFEDMHRGQVPASDMMSPSVEGEDGSQILHYDLYGLGWYSGYQRGHRVLMHFGSYPGAYSMITLLPDKAFGIFTSVNGGHMGAPYSPNSQIHTYAIDLALDTPPNKTTNTDKKACSDGERPGPDTENCITKHGLYSIPQRHLHKYAGTFANPAYGNVTLTVINTVVIFTYNHLELEAFPLSDEEFCLVAQGPARYIFYPRNMSFIFNSNEEVQEIVVSFLGGDDVFQKLPLGVSYEEWINSMCGAPTPPCEKTEVLPEVPSAAAAGQLSSMGLGVMLGLGILLA